MHAPLRILVAITFRVRPACCPPRPQQNDGAFGNPAVALLPVFDARHRQLVVRVARRFGSHINHHRRAKKALRRNLIHWGHARRKVNRRVKMRSVMLEHPEAARKITVLFDRSVHFGLKNLGVSGPGDELVADRIAEIHHSGFARRDALESVRRRGRVHRPHGGKPQQAPQHQATYKHGRFLSR